MIRVAGIIFIIQLIFASPFLIEPAALFLGWKLGANTSFEQYSQITKNHYFSGKIALIPLNMFWELLTANFLKMREYQTLRLLFIFLNIYYILIKK